MGEIISQVFSIGAAAAAFNGNDLGLSSEKGWTVKTKSSLVAATSAKYGQVPVAMIINGTEVEVDGEVIQTSIQGLQPIFPGASLIAGSGKFKIGFGLYAGTILAAATLTLTPVLSQNSQSTGLIFTLSSCVPVGDFEAMFDGKNYVWKVKFRGVITVGLANGQLMGTFGDPTAVQAGAATVSSIVPTENATSVSDSLASIVITMSGPLAANTVNTKTVLFCARPDSVVDTSFIATQVVLANNGASTTITITGPAGAAFSLGATTKYLVILTSEIQDQYGNNIGGYVSEFTTT